MKRQYLPSRESRYLRDIAIMEGAIAALAAIALILLLALLLTYRALNTYRAAAIPDNFPPMLADAMRRK